MRIADVGGKRGQMGAGDLPLVVLLGEARADESPPPRVRAYVGQ